MDGGIGAPRWFGDSNKRNKRIGKQTSGQRAFKLKRVNGIVNGRLWLWAYFEKRITGPAYRLFHPGGAVYRG